MIFKCYCFEIQNYLNFTFYCPSTNSYCLALLNFLCFGFRFRIEEMDHVMDQNIIEIEEEIPFLGIMYLTIGIMYLISSMAIYSAYP